MGALIYIGRRIAYIFVMIVGVSLLVFLISHTVPSDPVVANLSQRNMGNPKMVAEFRAKWGLDQPLYRQYLIYLNNLLHGDMGVSIRTQRPVLDDLKKAFPATVELAVFSMLIAIFFGLLFGIISAVKRNSALDQIVRAVSVMGVSVPSFWFGLMMLLIFYAWLGWAPGPGRLSPLLSPPPGVTGSYLIDAIIAGRWNVAADALRHLVLPGLVLGSYTMGFITRTTRSALLEVLSADYIRTAHAKGLNERAVIVGHAMGNALIPVITIIGLGFGNLLGGMVVVETVFAWQGIGQYAYQAAGNLDFPAIVGVAILVSLNYAVINLVIDILYGVIDPRVRYR
jgi:peptide/nickel transport system permease protein